MNELRMNNNSFFQPPDNKYTKNKADFTQFVTELKLVLGMI